MWASWLTRTDTHCPLSPRLLPRAFTTGTPPAPRYHHSAVVYGSSMFVFGKPPVTARELLSPAPTKPWAHVLCVADLSVCPRLSLPEPSEFPHGAGGPFMGPFP